MSESKSSRHSVTAQEHKLQDYAVKHRHKNGIAVIAEPLANEKLSSKCLKLVKKAAKAKAIRRGIKEVTKALRKGENGVMVLAGNITPIDVISHIPVLCEEKEIPYIWVPAKEELGAAGQTKRPTSVIMVLEKKDADYADVYSKCKKKIIKLNNGDQADDD